MSRCRRTDATRPAPCLPAADDPIWQLGHGAVSLRVSIEQRGGIVFVRDGELVAEYPADVADDVGKLISEYRKAQHSNEQHQEQTHVA